MNSTNLKSRTLAFNNPWIQQQSDTTKSSTALTFNDLWIEQPLDSTTLGLNKLGFNNPRVQQSWIHWSLDSTNLDSTILGFNVSCTQQSWIQQSLNSTYLNLAIFGFNDPFTQQSWIQQSLDSTTLISTILGFHYPKVKKSFGAFFFFFSILFYNWPIYPTLLYIRRHCTWVRQRRLSFNHHRSVGLPWASCPLAITIPQCGALLAAGGDVWMPQTKIFLLQSPVYGCSRYRDCDTSRLIYGILNHPRVFENIANAIYWGRYTASQTTLVVHKCSVLG